MNGWKELIGIKDKFAEKKSKYVLTLAVMVVAIILFIMLVSYSEARAVVGVITLVLGLIGTLLCAPCWFLCEKNIERGD